MGSILRIEHISKDYGGLRALDDVVIEVEEGSITGLIGPNGSGKTTLFDIISGFTRPTAGRVIFDGRDITGQMPFRIARAGVGRVFQLARIFRGMTLFQNLIVYAKPGGDAKQRVWEILRFLKLDHLAHQSAQGLSYGQQRLLELGCVLMMEPKLILLDEPAAGINPALLEDVMEHIRELARRGKTIFIIEHNIPLVANLCQRVVVLDSGRLLAEGDPQTVLNDARVREAYLGG